MSQTNIIINAVVALLKADLGTDYSVQGSFTQILSLDSEDLPRAMVFEPTEVSTEDELGGVSDETSISILLVRDPKEGVKMRDDADTVRTVFDKTPRITNTVDKALISDSVVLETLEKHTIAVLTLETVRERSA